MTRTIQNLLKEEITFYFGAKSLRLQPLEIKNWNVDNEDWADFLRANEHHEGVLFSLSGKTSKSAREKVAGEATEKHEKNLVENRKKGEMKNGSIKIDTSLKRVEE